jgi:signal peptidase I
MLRTFRLGDHLVISTTSLKKINPGDVILFRKEDDKEIVHRVLLIEPCGFVTRGDNNTFPDSELVSVQDILGVVTRFERRGKVYRVRGGKCGLVRSNLLRLWYKFVQRIYLIGVYPYRWLRQRRLIARFWHPNLTRIQLMTENEVLIKYIYNHRTIARWWPEKHSFECQKPYDLVIPNPEKTEET